MIYRILRIYIDYKYHSLKSEYSLEIHGWSISLNQFLNLTDWKPFRLVYVKHSLYHLLNPLCQFYILGEIYWLPHSFCQYKQVIRSLPWINVIKHLVKHHPQAPNITFYRVGISQNYLWRHVDGGSYTCLLRRVIFYFLFRYHLGKSEVRKF